MKVLLKDRATRAQGVDLRNKLIDQARHALTELDGQRNQLMAAHFFAEALQVLDIFRQLEQELQLVAGRTPSTATSSIGGAHASI